ncbi:hypothetical protein ANANG_G00136400 [Anguilla anguilla]|uniref:Uncharacterized protein n=1 Tax=Anguilla anguilla TaxID=7936 RepID=A0A9D3MA20_ANGAN|nr:hypothetical protein ANANG_G00136400 [Anguilla anguilla]
MMQTHIMVDGQQCQNIFTQPTSTTALNNPSYHGDYNGAWDNRSPAFVYQTPPVPPTNHPQHRGQQVFQSRHVTNGNHGHIVSPNMRPFPVSSSFGPIQGNTNQTVGSVHQQPLRNHFFTNGHVTYASSPANFPKTLYTAQQTPMRPDVYVARENQQNTQVFVQAHNYNISQESMRSSRPGNVPQLPASLSHGNRAINQGHLQRELILRQSTGGQVSIPAVQDAGAYHSLQDAGEYSSAQFYPCRESVNGDRGAWNNWHEAMRTGRRESLNLQSAVKVAMVEQKGGTWQGVRDLRQEMGSVRGVTKNCGMEVKLNPKFEVQCPTGVQGHVHGTECRGQGLATSSPNSAVPAQNTSLHPQPVDHTVSWAKPFLHRKVDGLLRSLLKNTEVIPNTGMPQVQAQCGETAIAPHSSLSWSSSPGSRSDKRFMNQLHMATAQQSYQSVPSQSGAVNPPQYHAFPDQQGELLSTGLQPPPTAQGPVGRNTKGAANQTYRRGLTMPPPYVSPGTKSGGTGEAVKHIKAIKMANHAPNQPSASGCEFPDAGSYHEPSIATSAFPSQAVQSGKLPCRSQTAGNSMTGSERQVVSFATTPGNAFTAGNESCMSNQPASQADAQHRDNQLSSAGDSVKADHRKDYGETCGAKSPQTDSAPLSDAGSPSPEHVFKSPKVSSQQSKSSGSSSSQKAVAVVTPLSPQSWDPADETSSTCQTESDLPCKILSVISLSAESTAGLFDFKMTDTAFDSLLISMGTGEKDPQNIHSRVPTTVSLGSASTELAVPHQKMTPQMSGSTCQVIPPTADDSATQKIDPQPSNQQKSDLTLPTNPAPPTFCEVTPPSGMHFNMPGAQTSVAVHENRDLDGELENTIFDLSSVSIIEWTTAKVAKLITFFHQIEGTPKQEMDVKKTAELFGLQGYDDLPDVFSSNLYQSIMAEARSVCKEGENLVFSQINPTSLEAVAENCQILKHCPVRPSEEEDEVVKSNQALKGKMVRPETVTCRSNRNTPLPTPQSQADCALVDGTVDALSSIKIRVLPPEEARRIYCGEESEIVKLDNPQSTLPALEGQGDEMSQMGVQAYQWQPEEQQKEVKQVDVSCCSFCWIKMTTSYKKGFCACQFKSKIGQGGEGESKIDITSNQMEKSERLEVMESSVGGDSCPAGEHNTISVHEPETTKEYLPEEDLPEEDLPEENQHIEIKALSVSECSQSRPADNFTQEEGNNTEGEAIVSSGEPEEGRGAPDPSECSSSEILFDPDITVQEVIIPVLNVTEVENENVYSDYEETLKMAAAVSEKLWNGDVAKGEPPILLKVNVDEVPTSGLEAEDGAASGNMRLSSQGEVPNQLPEPMDIRDLERRIGGQTSLSLRQRLHKRLPSIEKHNHKGENVRRGEKGCKRRRWEKSPCSTSPVREPSPQSVKISEREEAVIKGIEHSHHNREKPLLVKRKGDHCFASPKLKLPKLHKDVHVCQESNFEKRPFVSKGISSKESPKQKADGRGMYLTLYGSSSKTGNRVVSSSGESVFKSQGGKSLPAPLTLGLSIHSKDSNHSVARIKSPAKQQVFSIWERSFVPLNHHKRSKTETTKQGKIKGYSNLGVGTKAANPTVCGGDPKSSRIQCRPQSSSQSTAATVKRRECNKHMGKREEKRNSTINTGKSHLGKDRESSFVPKASNKHRGKSQEKSSVPETGNKLLGKIHKRRALYLKWETNTWIRLKKRRAHQGNLQKISFLHLALCVSPRTPPQSGRPAEKQGSRIWRRPHCFSRKHKPPLTKTTGKRLKRSLKK